MKKMKKLKKFNFGSITNNMEGKYRPGHFDGMATVVEKLLNIINPNYAFFGQGPSATSNSKKFSQTKKD